MAQAPIILRTVAEQAKYCRQLREEAGDTQARLASSLGYKTAQVVTNAENEEDPSRTNLRVRIIRHYRPRATVSTPIVVEE